MSSLTTVFTGKGIGFLDETIVFRTGAAILCASSSLNVAGGTSS